MSHIITPPTFHDDVTHVPQDILRLFQAQVAGAPTPSTGIVTAKRPNHVWSADLTAVPTSLGFWPSWLPFAPGLV